MQSINWTDFVSMFWIYSTETETEFKYEFSFMANFRCRINLSFGDNVDWKKCNSYMRPCKKNIFNALKIYNSFENKNSNLYIVPPTQHH